MGTSILYSRVCLYAQHWPRVGLQNRGYNQDVVVAATQRIADGWESLSLAPSSYHSFSSSGNLISDAQREQQMFEESSLKELYRQVALLHLLFDSKASCKVEPWPTDQAALGPIVLELVDILKDVQLYEPKAFVAEGPLLIHTAVGRTAFCFATRESFFSHHDLKKPQTALEGTTSDSNRCHDIAEITGLPADNNTHCHYEVSFVKAMETRLLQHLGWDVVSIPFFTWRK